MVGVVVVIFFLVCIRMILPQKGMPSTKASIYPGFIFMSKVLTLTQERCMLHFLPSPRLYPSRSKSVRVGRLTMTSLRHGGDASSGDEQRDKYPDGGGYSRDDDQSERSSLSSSSGTRTLGDKYDVRDALTATASAELNAVRLVTKRFGEMLCVGMVQARDPTH